MLNTVQLIVFGVPAFFLASTILAIGVGKVLAFLGRGEPGEGD
jgi:hypothetical protein